MIGGGGGASLGKAVLDLTADGSGLERDLDKAQGSAQTRFGRIQSAAQRASKYAGIALLAIGAGAVKSISAASDLDEAMNKTSATFGEAAADMPGFAGSVAKSLGMSRTEALNAAAGIGAMLIPMGKSQTEAAKMSSRMATLAADMGSFHNQDPTEMLDRLRAGLAGESEPLRQFGVNITEARVKAHAYEKGIADVGAELTEGQKVQARYSLIIQDAGAANGDFARTADGLANRQRILKAEVTDLAASLGAALVPAATAVVAVITGLVGWMQRHQTTTKIVIAVVAGLAAGILVLAASLKIVALSTAAWNAVLLANPLVLVAALIVGLVAAFVVAYKSSETFRNVVHAVFAGVTAVVQGFSGFFTTTLPAAFRAVLSWIRGNWPAIAAIVSGPFLPLVALATDAFGVRSALVGAFRAIVSAVTGAMASAVTAIRSAWGAALGAARGLGDRIWDGIKAGLAALGGLYRELWGKISGAIGAAAGAVGTAAAAIGRAIVSGVVNGLGGLVNAVRSKVESGLRSALGAVKPFSPVEHGGEIFIGRPLVAGAVAGIEGARGEITRALDGVIRHDVRMADAAAGAGVGRDTQRGGALVEVEALHVHNEMDELRVAQKMGLAVWRELQVG